MPVAPLSADALRHRCDPEQFAFDTTDELATLKRIVGQDRAVQAVRFGIGIQNHGYNLFAFGPPGVGKYSVVRRFLENQAAQMQPPPDLCYVHNFQDPNRPRALRMPPGRGAPFRRDMEALVGMVRVAIPAAFEAEDYRARRHAIEEEFKGRHEADLEAVNEEAHGRSIAVIRTPVGVALAPTRGDEVLSPEDFHKLPEAEQERRRAEMNRLQEKLEEALRKVPQLEKQARDKIKELNREVANFAIGHIVDEIRSGHTDLPVIGAYLNEVRQDIIENVEEFLGTEPRGPEATARTMAQATSGEPSPLRRYRVNLMVDHGAMRGAPVVYEDNPNLQNLLGRIEHIAQYGALLTDYNLIQPGALHRANGGYLILDARKVLLQPFAWEALKRALSAHEVKIESLNQVFSVVSTVSLEPEPVPLEVKVVLLGEPQLYYLLAEHDPDFEDLFKVAVDFETEMDRTPESLQLYARMVAEIARHDGFKPLDRQAVARVVEHASRLASDAGKVTVHLRSVSDLLSESSYWAGMAGRAVISAKDVERAIETRINRIDRLRERSYEQILNGTVLIESTGTATGQVNGLSVLQLGSFTFGRPTRITARVRVGKGEVVDIEREVALGGPLHSKGVLILEGFLRGRYCLDKPLTLAASLVFEQSYGGVEGDSASSTELYALLSALADVPIRQSFAVTGSVNQLGQVQAIGGVNEKIEGFFDICNAKGLTGEQGVLIPASNVRHLMLRPDVVQAARDGRFHIYPVAHIDEGIGLLTGIPAGDRDASGKFPDGSVNARVEARLSAFAETARAFARTLDEKS
ncbi:MAG: Lon protease family protein [Gemmatimonas sp.]